MLVEHLADDGMAVCNAFKVVAVISDAVGQDIRKLVLRDALATTRILSRTATTAALIGLKAAKV